MKIRKFFTFENCDLRIYSKETKTMEYFLVGFFSLWDFVLFGYFPTWDFFLMGFYPLGFCPHGIFSYMGFVLMGFFPRTNMGTLVIEVSLSTLQRTMSNEVNNCRSFTFWSIGY